MTANDPAELRKIYGARFEKALAYRRRVWGLLVRDVFQRYVKLEDSILDLGCGYGEFINQVRCREKWAMDLNPDAPKYLDASVRFLEQDSSTQWPLSENALSVVFTSNFFEHLPSKALLKSTLEEVFRCLKPKGTLIAMGPNIKYLAGSYWDFWDHHLSLSDVSLCEGMISSGFVILKCVDRFLPFSMVNTREYPDIVIATYLRLPFAWKIFGRQFLIVAEKP
jgi:SAM-dependent methyltransferase